MCLNGTCDTSSMMNTVADKRAPVEKPSQIMGIMKANTGRINLHMNSRKVFSLLSSSTFATNSTRAGLANSEGWRLNPKIEIQRVLSFRLSPMNNVSKTNKKAPINKK